MKQLATKRQILVRNNILSKFIRFGLLRTAINWLSVCRVSRLVTEVDNINIFCERRNPRLLISLVLSEPLDVAPRPYHIVVKLKYHIFCSKLNYAAVLFRSGV